MCAVCFSNIYISFDIQQDSLKMGFAYLCTRNIDCLYSIVSRWKLEMILSFFSNFTYAQAVYLTYKRLPSGSYPSKRSYGETEERKWQS